MFLNDDDIQERVSSLDNLVNRLSGSKVKSITIRKTHNGGRPLGRKNDTDETKADIGIHSIIHGPSETASTFNTTISRASLLSKGISTHSNGVDPDLAEKVQDKKELVHNRALDLIISSLDNLENSLPKVTKATDISTIAANLSKIADRTGTRSSNEDTGPKVQVVVYAPRVKSVDEYEMVEG